MNPTALLPTPGPVPVAAVAPAAVAAPPAAAAAVVAVESDELELLPHAAATRARPVMATTASRVCWVRGAVTLMSFLGWRETKREQRGGSAGGCRARTDCLSEASRRRQPPQSY